MIRELVLIQADLTATPWYAVQLPPQPPLPAGWGVQVVTSQAEADQFAAGPVADGDVAQRFAGGDRCIVLRNDDNAIVGQMWSSVGPRFIDWIGCDVTPPADSVLLYNAWVDPAARGRGGQWAMAAAACGDAVRRGFGWIYAGVERHEYPPFARRYAALGLAVIEPVASLWAARVFGRCFTARLPPPRKLHSATKAARDLFARAGESN